MPHSAWRKDSSNPNGVEDRPKSGIIFTQPASQPPTRPPQSELKFWEYLSSHWSDLTKILNLSLGWPTNIYKCFKWRRPWMEDDLKILKVEYLSNHWSDPTQIRKISLFLNLELGDQSEVFRYFKWRRPPMEDDLKIWKVEYLSNH